MKVAVVTTHPIQYQVPWLRLLARQEGIDLHVFFAMIPDAVEQGREFGVAFEWDMPLLGGYRHTLLENVAREPSLTRFSGCDTPQIDREIRDGNFDAVIVNGWVVKTCLQALWACLRTGTPCIVRGEVNGLRPRAAWKRFLHRLLLARYSAVLAIGRRNRDYCLAAGVPEGKLFDTPYCVDNDRFAGMADSCRREPGRNALLEEFGLDPEAVTFLFSGKLVDKKRPGDILAAMQLLRARGVDRVQLLLVGDGPLRAELEEQARGLQVRFAGFLNQSEIGKAYAASDCLVLPSDSGETWGLVVNEAMASGLPALVSDQVGSAIDLVSPGVTGDVFACGDIEALAQAMARHAERGHLAGLGEAARDRVREGYNFERVVQGAMAALRSLAPRKN